MSKASGSATAANATAEPTQTSSSTVSSSTTSEIKSEPREGTTGSNSKKVVSETSFSHLSEDDDAMSSSSSNADGMDEDDPMDEGLTSRLASAGPTGVAAAAAISSTKKRKRAHSFETNPSVRKRQQTRLLRKLRQHIEEYSLRVGQQAVIIIATPSSGRTSSIANPINNFKVFGAKPLEDVVRSLKTVIMTELDTALANHTPPTLNDDPTRHELPPLVIDGIPTPVEKMTQAQLRAFIPHMLKYSTGRGKPGWGKDSTRPPWWPENVPWANVRMDARSEDEKQKVSWTLALREIVTNCYKYHDREDLLPVFNDEETQSNSGSPVKSEGKKVTLGSSSGGRNVQQLLTAASSSATSTGQFTPTILQTISNPDGTVSIVQLDTSNQYIQLPDGTTAQIQGIAQIDPGHQGVHTLAEVATSGEHQLIEVSGTTGEVTQDGQILLTAEDGQTYPVSLSSGMITVPVATSMYQQQVVTSVQSGESAGTLVLSTPMQVTAVASSTSTVAKVEPTDETSAREKRTTTTTRGLTITPVVSSASTTTPSSRPTATKSTVASGNSSTTVISSNVSSNASGPKTRRAASQSATATKSASKK